jgi:hypothetical protein
MGATIFDLETVRFLELCGLILAIRVTGAFVNSKSKRLRKPITMGHCTFCGQPLALSVSDSGIRIFRCQPCGLFGQAVTPPRVFRPRPREKRRKRKLWRVAS